MQSEAVFIILFVVASSVAIAVRRLHVPYTVALVAAGLLLGVLHLFEAPQLTRDLLFSLFLPGLLFEAAFHIEFRQLWRNRWTVTALAVPGVIAATAITALTLAPVVEALGLATGFGWRQALVFGALISATDPIAVVAIFRSLGAPRRLTMLLEGESLLNDGTAIVFFSLSLGLLAGGGVDALGLAKDFVIVVGAGATMGLAIGIAVSQVIRHVDDPMIEITLTTIAAYGSFLMADRLGYSGVIATVAAGLVCGNWAAPTGMSPSTRLAVEAFWDYVAFALNSIVFLLLGLEVHLETLLSAWQAIGVAFILVSVTRAVVVAGASVVLRHTRERIPWRWSALLAWGGLRGGLPMVLVLSLPSDFPHREFLITMTFGVVLLSILGNGLTMPRLLRALGIVGRGDARASYEIARGRLEAARAALSELDRMEQVPLGESNPLAALKEEYEDRIQRTEEEMRDLQPKEEDLRAEEVRWVRRHLVLAERARVVEAFHRGAIGQDAYTRLLADIDARLLRAESEPEQD
ncbi:MAG: Na+/H+ antiporter [Myxococcales bacterium]|jgi:CPA1 family monovalent cation:H+ antiporter